MPYYAPSKEAAERAAKRLAAYRVGLPVSDPTMPGRTVTGYVVERYTMPNSKFRHSTIGDAYHFEWGVVERWRYDDRPDLGEFGGAFVDLTTELLT